MLILLWLVPALLVTLGAMAVAGWVGRERPEADRSSEAAQARFAAAINRKHPGDSVSPPRPVRDRSTGIAVRAHRTGPRPSPEAALPEAARPEPAARPAARPAAPPAAPPDARPEALPEERRSA